MLSANPTRTADGQDELARRSRGLTQRQRTVLFLVDGRRGEEAVRALARQAGVDAAVLDELARLGLVLLPPHPVDPAAPLDLSLETAPAPLPEAADDAFEQARAALLRVVLAHAPVSGAVVVERLRQAASPDTLEALVDEVEQCLRRPRLSPTVMQSIRHARQLLGAAAGA